jgi:hypothetical protein
MSSAHGGNRPGAGRRRALRGCRAVSVTLDQPTLAKLDAWCEALGVTRSQALRILICAAPQPKPRSKQQCPTIAIDLPLNNPGKKS